MKHEIFILIVNAFSIANYRINELTALSNLNRTPKAMIGHKARWCVIHDRVLNGRNIYLNDPKQRFNK